MFSRFRIAFGLALLLTFITFVTAFAKGSFSFITISSPNLKDAVRVTDPALTTDFFAFADFYQAETGAPANPGIGYEITRSYVTGNSHQDFDQLHYYPESSLVYYDGIINGSSEYDDKWYIAKADIKPSFYNALSNQAHSNSPIEQSRAIIPILITAGLAAVLVLAFWFYKTSTQ